MINFWNQRYKNKEYVYGTEANEYFKSKILMIPAGKILLPAEGEGRNAVFAAKLGWDVFAFDQSIEGKKKAEILAFQNKVSIQYDLANAEEMEYEKESFDAIAMLYTHFPQEKRKEYHKKISSFLKKSGVLIFEGFSKNHIQNQKTNKTAGGPKEISALCDLEELKSEWKDFDFIEIEETKTELNEGLFHVGKASVIRIFAIKK